jgi:hypothetical protein
MFAAIRSPRTLVLACAGLSLMALAIVLPRAARADNNAMDITSDVVQVHVAYPDKDTQKMIEMPISSDMLSPLVQQKLNTPLGQQFDNMWNNIVVDKNSDTMQQMACSQIQQGVRENINSSKYQAYDVNCALASSGQLLGTTKQLSGPFSTDLSGVATSSGKDPRRLSLDYVLTGNAIDFSLTTPYTCHDGSWHCPADPRVRVTFDLDLQLIIDYDSQPCQAQIEEAWVSASNPNLSGDNVTADIGLTANDIVGFVSNAVTFGLAETHLFDTQTALNQINNMGQPLSSNNLPQNGLLSLLTTVCQAAADRGFSDMQMRIDPGALTLLFIHPPIGAPTLIDPNAPCPQPCLINNNVPAIMVAPQQVHPGDTLTVYGSGFNTQSSSSLTISWYHDYNASAPIGHSDVRWGPQYGPQQTSTVNNNSWDEGAFGTPNTLQPGTAYQFSVRDCDQITCSPWSSPLTLKTAAAGSNQVTLRLDDPNAGAQLGTLTVQPDGTLSGTASLPGSIAPGQHTLYAIQPLANSGPQNGPLFHVQPLPGYGGGSAASTYPSATFTVVQARTTLQPVLQAFDSKNKPLMYPYCGAPIILHGDHFAPGGQVTITFSAYKKQGTLDNAAVKSNGSFDILLTLPNDLTECFNGGIVTLTANESTGSGTLQATIQLQFLAQPR